MQMFELLQDDVQKEPKGEAAGERKYLPSFKSSRWLQWKGSAGRAAPAGAGSALILQRISGAWHSGPPQHCWKPRVLRAQLGAPHKPVCPTQSRVSWGSGSYQAPHQPPHCWCFAPRHASSQDLCSPWATSPPQAARWGLPPALSTSSPR